MQPSQRNRFIQNVKYQEAEVTGSHLRGCLANANGGSHDPRESRAKGTDWSGYGRGPGGKVLGHHYSGNASSKLSLNELCYALIPVHSIPQESI